MQIGTISAVLGELLFKASQGNRPTAKEAVIALNKILVALKADFQITFEQ